MPQTVQLLFKKEAIVNGTGYPSVRPNQHVKKVEQDKKFVGSIQGAC